MKKPILLFCASALVILVHSSWCAPGLGVPLNSQNTTGKELLRAFDRHDPDYHMMALLIIADIYGAKINNGIVPDSNIRQGLGEITYAYLLEHPDLLNRSAEELVVAALKGVSAQIEEQKALWGRALRDAEAYFLTPSPENAERFFLALPDKHLPPIAFDQEILVIDIAFADGNFSLLEKKIDEGEPNAMDVGFRLINISDGANSEILYHVLGGILLKHPRLFIDKIAFHLGNRSPKEFDGQLQYLLNPVAWWEIPEDDEDQTKYQALFKKNKELRIKALKSVENDDLENIRDRCLAILLAILEEIGN